MECISTKCCYKSYHSCLINIDFSFRNNKIVSSYICKLFLKPFFYFGKEKVELKYSKKLVFPIINDHGIIALGICCMKTICLITFSRISLLIRI